MPSSDDWNTLKDFVLEDNDLIFVIVKKVNWVLDTISISSDYFLFDSVSINRDSILDTISINKASIYLKSKDDWEYFIGSYWDRIYEYNSNDKYGFKGLPAGYTDYGGEFQRAYGSMNRISFFWSSTEIDSLKAYHYRMDYTSGYLRPVNERKNNTYSVRCLKD